MNCTCVLPFLHLVSYFFVLPDGIQLCYYFSTIVYSFHCVFQIDPSKNKGSRRQKCEELNWILCHWRYWGTHGSMYTLVWHLLIIFPCSENFSKSTIYINLAFYNAFTKQIISAFYFFKSCNLVLFIQLQHQHNICDESQIS